MKKLFLILVLACVALFCATGCSHDNSSQKSATEVVEAVSTKTVEKVNKITCYDSDGNIFKTTTMTYSPKGNITSEATNGTNVLITSTYSYDHNEKLTSVHSSSVIDGCLYKTVDTYENGQKKISTIISENEEYLVSYGYKGTKNTQEICYTKEGVIKYYITKKYDAKSQLLSEEIIYSQDEGVATKDLETFLNSCSHIDKKKIYDSKGDILMSVDYTDDENEKQTLTYRTSYDQKGNKTACFDDYSSGWICEYDSNGNILKKSVYSHGEIAYVYNYEYEKLEISTDADTNSYSAEQQI